MLRHVLRRFSAVKTLSVRCLGFNKLQRFRLNPAMLDSLDAPATRKVAAAGDMLAINDLITLRGALRYSCPERETFGTMASARSRFSCNSGGGRGTL
jgi:hypothetical protein